MKKILFATTALVATAGVAAADVSFGGYARFGVDYDEKRTSEETRLESRFRLVVTASAESDNGLEFGAQIRYQANEGASGYAGKASVSGTAYATDIGTATTTSGTTTTLSFTANGDVKNSAAFNNPRFWVSTGGLTVSVGHVMGAFEYMPGMYAGTVGLTGLGYANVVTNYGVDFYTSGGTGRMGFDIVYSVGAFGVHLTHSFDDEYLALNNEEFSRTAIVASYSMGDYTFAIGAQDSDVDTDTDFAFTASGDFGPLTATLQFADNGTADQKYGIAMSYDLSTATTISGYVNHDDAADDENIGLGFKHNLGGGTSIRGGIAELAGGRTRADIGMLFSF